jgi:predicted O-methyltransferase YrrM
MESYGMLNWTHDLPPNCGAKLVFLNVLEMLRPLESPRILEVGTFAGTSIGTMARLFPSSRCWAVDNWKLADSELRSCWSISGREFTMSDVRAAFVSNVEGFDVTLYEGDSVKILPKFVREGLEFDFIYVDGSHKTLDTAVDLVFSWHLVAKGGILAIDDYLWNAQEGFDIPKPAIDHFLQQHENEYIVLDKAYRIFLQKL